MSGQSQPSPVGTVVVMRREGEAVVVGSALVKVVSFGPGRRVKLAITAPKSVPIARTEAIRRTPEDRR